MKVTETQYGKEIWWGYDCKETIRDLRKLNGEFDKHAPCYDDLCKRNDELTERVVNLCQHLDEICKAEEGKWSEEGIAQHDRCLESLEEAEREIDEICCEKYPKAAYLAECCWCA